jgi:hypothetical protein
LNNDGSLDVLDVTGTTTRFVAADSLAPVTTTTMLGLWEYDDQHVITLFAEGNDTEAKFGACDVSWRLEPDSSRLILLGSFPDLTACAPSDDDLEPILRRGILWGTHSLHQDANSLYVLTDSVHSG